MVPFCTSGAGDVRGVREDVCVRGDAGGVLVRGSEADGGAAGGAEGEVSGVRVPGVPGRVFKRREHRGFKEDDVRRRRYVLGVVMTLMLAAGCGSKTNVPERLRGV